MKFTVSTKPLKDSINLAVIKKNVVDSYRKSGLALITADNHELKINLESDKIYTQVVLQGSGDETEERKVYVDCIRFRDIVSTFTASVTTIEFIDNGVRLHSGSSKITLPKIIDVDNMELEVPATPTDGSATIDLNKANWKFVENHQMYAKPTSIENTVAAPVYINIWCGADKDIIVGDMINNLFTHSKKSDFTEECLISDLIVNLFNAVPDGAKIYKTDKGYAITVSTDGYSYLSEFMLVSENGTSPEDYNAQVFLNMFNTENKDSIGVDTTEIMTFLNQFAIVDGDSTSKPKISIRVDGDNMTLISPSIEQSVNIDNPKNLNFELAFDPKYIRSIITNLDNDKVRLYPLENGGKLAGLIASTDEMQVIFTAWAN